MVGCPLNREACITQLRIKNDVGNIHEKGLRKKEAGRLPENIIVGGESKMEDEMKLTLDDLEEINGGVGGSPDPLPDYPGYVVYRIKPGDNLTNLAKTYKTTIEDLYTVNKKYINHRSDITQGFYMYVPDIFI